MFQSPVVNYVVKERKDNCATNKLQRFKPPLVQENHFPSRVSLNKELEDTSSENVELRTKTSFSSSAAKQEFKKPPITYWRRAEYTDRDAVSKLIEQSDFDMNELFGEIDVPNLIEKASFSLLQFNSKEEIISFTTVLPYPNIPAVPSFEWYPWLQALYKLKDLTPRNTFFIHYMIWKNEYYHDFLRLALETIFLENRYANFLIIVKPPKVKLPSIVPEKFVQVLPVDAELYDCDCNFLQTLLLCFRHSLMERLKVRLALVEDHDDLMPIAEDHTDKLRSLYGEYCMAEIIEYPGTEERKTLVCESMGYAVGFMILNRAADFELLNSQFDLGVFHGLRKPSENDKMAEVLPDDPEGKPIYLPDQVDPLVEAVDSQTMLRLLNWQPTLCVNTVESHNTVRESSDESESEYNEINNTLSNLVKETLNVRLVPKFSAYDLNVKDSQPIDRSESSLSIIDKRMFDDSTIGEESSIQTEPSLLSLQYYNLPTYTGPPNAFVIEFYAMNKNFDDRLCHEFLVAAFEQFPDLEYCMLTIPSQTRTFPLLDYFIRVTPRPLKRFRQELYVCHKSSVSLSFILVRRVTKSDLDEIRKLLQGIQNNEFILADIANSCYYEDSAYQSFVLINLKSIVGVAVLCNEYGMEYLTHHYHVSDLIDFDLHKIDYHAILKHLVLSPIYQPHARFFLRDIMRMADVTALYRARYEEVESNWNRASLITVIGQLLPVKPRRMVKYHKPSLGENIPPAYLIDIDLPFSLYHINTRMCQIKRLISNINLVVVGTSRTAYSFLENLIFSSSSACVIYNNIIWVAPHGMGTELPSHPARDFMFPSEGKFNRFYKIQISLKTFVNFVFGVMTSINRVDKYITINNESILPYDYLVLLCGRQFVMPIPEALEPNVKDCRRNFRPRCSLFKYLIAQQPKEETQDVTYPGNMFIVNTEVDATNAFICLQYLYQRKKSFKIDEKIVIYGHNISTYLCAQALLKYGIPAKLIIIVEPFPSGIHSVSCFKDDNIDRAVLKTLQELKIQHFKGFSLYDWTICNNQIQSITFHSDFRRITFKCLAFFPFERKSVSEVTFKAVNEASLVYDGKLVINNKFQTNDPYIYAAGGLTKYQRKYYAKNKSHHYYDSSEVGKHLAEIIRKKIDPTQDNAEEEEPSDLVPNLTDPIVLSCTLPGDWNFFNVRKPGKFVHPETQAGIKEFGDILITGNCDMTDGYGYFKLELDDYGFVSGIYCYTKDVIDGENLEMLYGKHEKLLNSLLLRFELGQIKDFYSFFREPWAYAIFHDRFGYVLKKNYDFFYDEKPTANNAKIVDLAVDSLKSNNWQKPTKEKLREMKEKFEEAGLHDKVCQNILNFLYYFDEPFPMYATPRILRVLLQSADTSLLHKPANESGVTSRPGIRISELMRRY